MELAIFGLRGYWFFIQLLGLLRDKETIERIDHYYLVLVWLIAAYAIPHLFWLPRYRDHKVLFSLSVLLLSGSLQFFLIFEVGEIPTYLLLEVLFISCFMTRKTAWVIVPTIFAIPLAGAMLENLPLGKALISMSDTFLFLGIGLGFNFLVRVYLKNNELMIEVETQNKLLVQYANQIERLSVLEERNRMSKELHDLLGHSFISSIMGLDAAIMLIDKKPELAKEKLEQLRELTAANLEDIRLVVHDLGQEEEISFVSQLKETAKEFGEHTGTNIQFSSEGVERELRFQVRNSLLRVLQECLTNAIKHGKASRIDIKTYFAQDKLTMDISDNGRGMKTVQYGFGLKGMKERIETMRGEMAIVSGIGAGTRITCEIPLGGNGREHD